jgi:hypothetical protein
LFPLLMLLLLMAMALLQLQLKTTTMISLMQTRIQLLPMRPAVALPAEASTQRGYKQSTTP